MNDGWLKLFYRFRDWEWYGDTNMVRVFIHLLLSANYKPIKWRGTTVPRGSFITSLDSLAKATGLSIQNIRTCLDRLVSTNEITSVSTNRFRIITICKFDLYQDENIETNNQTNKLTTSNQQSINNQVTTSKEYKKKRNNISSSLRSEDTSAGAADAEVEAEELHLDLKKLMAFFNSTMEKCSIPQIKSILGQRRAFVLARCREYGKEAIHKVILKSAASDFLNGCGSRGFRADFNWIFRPNNFPKILEGTYDNRVNNNETTQGYDTQSQDRYAKRRGADSTARCAEDYTDSL